ncbi:MAG: DEAD/DEAH box helicase [Candidatus Aenigmatarchaeota archaeon]|nr:DEAD/DEAH box helicase [Nanoarchaeota archaeon]
MQQFKKLGIIEPILRVIEEEKFEKPTEIQIKTIPLVIAGKDVIAGSATGSGKTLAFGSGIIQNSEPGRGIQALIMTPTRELAEQNAKMMIKFSRYKPLRMAVVYGGVSINPQIDKLRTADVVIGTPGRLLDHIQRRTIRLREVKTLVLDEADRMLDMGFIDDVERIIRECPQKRQTLLFSATITQDVARLSKRYMKDPVKISAEQFVDASKLKQVYYDVPDDMKFSLLVHLLKNEKSGLVMVFCNTRRYVDFVANNLNRVGIKAQAIHGGFSQEKRTMTMNNFHSKNVYVLVCTDVAARGLDIKGVSHVYNYDIPDDSNNYTHRVGRTARAGKEGKAVSILSNRDYDNFRRVLSDDSQYVKREPMPNIKKIFVQRERSEHRPARTGYRSDRTGHRPSRSGHRTTRNSRR